MLKELSVLLLFCFSIFSFSHQTNTAFAYNSANYPYVQNERFVILALRTLHSAEATYNATSGNGDYGSLNNLRQAEFIDVVLASGRKYGYLFVIETTAHTNTSDARYFITATPQSYRKTGRISFYIDETGVMRGADKNGAPATADDLPIEK